MAQGLNQPVVRQPIEIQFLVSVFFFDSLKHAQTLGKVSRSVLSRSQCVLEMEVVGVHATSTLREFQCVSGMTNLGRTNRQQPRESVQDRRIVRLVLDDDPVTGDRLGILLLSAMLVSLSLFFACGFVGGCLAEISERRRRLAQVGMRCGRADIDLDRERVRCRRVERASRACVPRCRRFKISNR